MNSLPSISVIVPVYNGDRYLQEAIQSVLDQTYPAQEIIVIDDGSTDESAAIARQFSSVKVITQGQQGEAAARNHGIELATGEFIAFLDADDRWMPTKLENQVQAFTDNPLLDLVFTNVQQFISRELAPETQARLYCPPDPMVGKIPTTVMLRRSLFQRVGFLNPQLTIGAFMDWFVRAEEIGINILTLPQTLAERRIHTTNMGVQLRNSRSDYVQLIKAALDRRRSRVANIPPLSSQEV
jgi:glycosyltransferase involved in cell wall biosynthesis